MNFFCAMFCILGYVFSSIMLQIAHNILCKFSFHYICCAENSLRKMESLGCVCICIENIRVFTLLVCINARSVGNEAENFLEFFTFGRIIQEVSIPSVKGYQFFYTV